MVWPLSQIAPSQDVEEDQVDESRRWRGWLLNGGYGGQPATRLVNRTHLHWMARPLAEHASRAIFNFMAPRDEAFFPDPAFDSIQEIQPAFHCRWRGRREGTHYGLGILGALAPVSRPSVPFTRYSRFKPHVGCLA